MDNYSAPEATLDLPVKGCRGRFAMALFNSSTMVPLRSSTSSSDTHHLPVDVKGKEKVRRTRDERHYSAETVEIYHC